MTAGSFGEGLMITLTWVLKRRDTEPAVRFPTCLQWIVKRTLLPLQSHAPGSVPRRAPMGTVTAVLVPVCVMLVVTEPIVSLPRVPIVAYMEDAPPSFSVALFLLLLEPVFVKVDGVVITVLSSFLPRLFTAVKQFVQARPLRLTAVTAP